MSPALVDQRQTCLAQKRSVPITPGLRHVSDSLFSGSAMGVQRFQRGLTSAVGCLPELLDRILRLCRLGAVLTVQVPRLLGTIRLVSGLAGGCRRYGLGLIRSRLFSRRSRLVFVALPFPRRHLECRRFAATAVCLLTVPFTSAALGLSLGVSGPLRLVDRAGFCCRSGIEVPAVIFERRIRAQCVFQPPLSIPYSFRHDSRSLLFVQLPQGF